jgi:hypothetical protein
MPTNWSEIPEIDDVKYRRVLAQYGLTMEYVQSFEHTLKMLYILSKVQIKAAKAPLSEEEFNRFLSDKGMIGPTLRKLRTLFDEIGLDKYPKKMEEGLDSMRDIRNWLAHSYLIDNSRVLPQGEAHEDLIRELRFFAEAFKDMTSSWTKLLNAAIEKLGEGTRKEIEEQLGPIMDEIQREQLRERVKGYALDD